MKPKGENTPAGKQRKSKTSKSRRSFVKLLPALGAAGLVATRLPAGHFGSNANSYSASVAITFTNSRPTNHKGDVARG